MVQSCNSVSLGKISVLVVLLVKKNSKSLTEVRGRECKKSCKSFLYVVYSDMKSCEPFLYLATRRLFLSSFPHRLSLLQNTLFSFHKHNLCSLNLDEISHKNLCENPLTSIQFFFFVRNYTISAPINEKKKIGEGISQNGAFNQQKKRV